MNIKNVFQTLVPFLVLSVSLLPVAISHSKEVDLLIKGGTIIDGSGKPGIVGDVAIQGDTIVAIGSLAEGPEPIKPKKVIDASGKIVASGFIDIHTHADMDILDDRYAANFVMQGTTTVVGGNCGYGMKGVGAFLEKLNKGGTGPNIAILVGHGDVRKSVMGMANRPPSADELEKMKALVRKGMEEGAFGISSGLMYAPGFYADVKEIAELCKVIVPFDGFYASHIREQSYAVEKSWQEIIDTGKLSGARVNIAHVKVIGQKYWGVSKNLVKMLNEARGQGIRVYADGYPYEAGATTIVGALIPAWAQADGRQATVNRLRDEKLMKEKLRKEIEELLFQRGGAQAVLITEFKADKNVEKKRLSEIMTLWKMEDPVAVIAKIVEMGNAGAVFFHASEDDQVEFYKNPFIAVASDASVAGPERWTNKLVHPRYYGTMPKYLARYVRELKLVAPEEGLRRMSSLSATIAGISDRGLLVVGKKADLVVLEFSKVNDKATYTDPHKFPEGIEHVIINGQLAVESGVHQKILSGRGLYKNR